MLDLLRAHGGLCVLRHVVDISARSHLVREQPLLSHAWVATPAEVLEFVRHPRPELKKLGIRLPSDCQIETILQNHDWLAGRSHGMTDGNRLSVFVRGEGDGKRFYRVTLYASKKREEPPDQPLLHQPDEEQRRARPIPETARLQNEVLRRSMLAAPLQLGVHEWLAPLTLDLPGTKSADEAHRIFTGIVQIAQRLVAEDPGMQAAMDDIASHLQKRFNRDYTGLFRRFGTPDVPFHRAFAGLMYARALWWIRASRLQRDALLDSVVARGDDPQPTFRVLGEAIESLDPDFVAHAIVAATIRRREESFFDARLSEAERFFDTFDPGPPGSSRFASHPRGLELFAPSNSSEWWYLPGVVAFAVATWSVRRGPVDTTEVI